MQVILLQRIERLGQMGDVVKVRPGYARNFLIPQKKALRASKENLEHFQNQKIQLEASNLKLKAEADAVAKKMEGLTLMLLRQAGDGGQLYGSVSTVDVAVLLVEKGFSVSRQQIQLNQKIKSVGQYPVKVILHPEVHVTLDVRVVTNLDDVQSPAVPSPTEAA